MTYEQLEKVNKELEGTDIGKGKKYALVNDRVRAFRKLFPNGCITTDLISLENGVATMKATLLDEDGKIISSGLAQEKEGAGFVNKTSFIENCETSAVGRALAFAGIGIDESIASADEVANAILQQSAKTEVISKKEQTVLKNMVEAKGWKVEEIFPKGLAITGEQYTQALETLKTLKKKGE